MSFISQELPFNSRLIIVEMQLELDIPSIDSIRIWFDSVSQTNRTQTLVEVLNSVRLIFLLYIFYYFIFTFIKIYFNVGI